MTVKEFLNDKLSSLLLHLVSMMSLTAFLLMTGTSGDIVTIVIIVWILGIVTIETIAFHKTNIYINELERIMVNLDQKYLFTECISKPKSTFERRLFDLVRRSGKAMIEAVSDAQAGKQEYREYIESWVHEIKAPITAAELICQNSDTNTRRKLMKELSSVENHVERALFYARAESAEKDFIIRQTSLSELVTGAVEKHRSLLMQSGVRLEMNDLDCLIYTDSKWAVFMIGQLLQNAVRYRSDHPFITLSSKTLGQQIQLTVQDNGIGIPTHELPRIFDRGFTGSNGRTRGGSTGMGLYICRKLADLLFIDIKVTSSTDGGTTITMTFPAKSNLSKM